MPASLHEDVVSYLQGQGMPLSSHNINLAMSYLGSSTGHHLRPSVVNAGHEDVLNGIGGGSTADDAIPGSYPPVTPYQFPSTEPQIKQTELPPPTETTTVKDARTGTTIIKKGPASKPPVPEAKPLQRLQSPEGGLGPKTPGSFADELIRQSQSGGPGSASAPRMGGAPGSGAQAATAGNGPGAGGNMIGGHGTLIPRPGEDRGAGLLTALATLLALGAGGRKFARGDARVPGAGVAGPRVAIPETAAISGEVIPPGRSVVSSGAGPRVNRTVEGSAGGPVAARGAVDPNTMLIDDLVSRLSAAKNATGISGPAPKLGAPKPRGPIAMPDETSPVGSRMRMPDQSGSKAASGSAEKNSGTSKSNKKGRPSGRTVKNPDAGKDVKPKRRKKAS